MFWNRKGNKSSAAGRTPETLHQPLDQHVDVQPSPPRMPRPEETFVRQEPPPPPRAPEPLVAAKVAMSSPHDAAVSEVHAKMLQVEQLSAMRRTSTIPLDPLSDAVRAPRSTVEPLFDPATGAHRGHFESPPMDCSGDSEQHPDEAWTHLNRIRELQSEIAAMHTRMEGTGDGSGSRGVEVDVDVDVDTVPTQEEEEAADREKEFAKLPSKFKGRSDDIDAMMAKLDVLSQAVTAFHAIQPPPLNFDSAPTSRENTRSDTLPSSSEIVIPGKMRTRINIPSGGTLGTKVGPDQNQITEVVHDSPTSFHANSLAQDVSTH